jgi:hypothetical protein
MSASNALACPENAFFHQSAHLDVPVLTVTLLIREPALSTETTIQQFENRVSGEEINYLCNWIREPSCRKITQSV